jgi:tetratricopeptide (TPR) repeat protein
VGDLVFLKLGPRRGMRRATSALQHYERGLALEASDPAAAMAAYRRAVAARPDLADAHNNLGRLHHDAGDLSAAEACYRRALAADATPALYHFNLGVVLEDRGDARGAIAAYERAIALDSMLADAHFNLARQLEQLGRIEHDDLVMRRAIRHLKQYRDLSRTAG